jgi:hypothetical protein
MTGFAIHITRMSFDKCDPMKWRQDQVLNCLTITAVDVNKDGQMFSKKVSERNVDSQEHDNEEVNE